MVKNEKLKTKLLSVIKLSILPLLLVALLVLISPVKSKNKAYYSGDATVFNGKTIVGSTNMGSLELFTLEDGQLVRQAKIKSFDSTYSGLDDFYDLAFSAEGAGLYAYLVDGRYLYKYNISNPRNPVLVTKLKDNSWDWFLGVDKVGGKILTKGTKGVKVWNDQLQVIDSFQLTNKNQYSINFDNSSNYIFNIDKDNLKIFDTKLRQTINEQTIGMKEDHGRKIFYDINDGKIYLADDKKVMQLNYGGFALDNYPHNAKFGYDVAGINGQPYIYSTIGTGVVKISKADMQPINSANTTNLGGKMGWAMGLNVVKDNSGEKIIIFNNSNILVLDGNLKKISSYGSSESETKSNETLSLKANTYIAAANSQIILNGTGFGLNEDLSISLAGSKFSGKTDDNGRFTQILIVPNVLPVRTDIKVDGLNSKITYSTSFQIN